MHCSITRRDFLNGMALSLAAALSGATRLAAFAAEAAPESSPDYYPPAWTGLRGSHPGAFEAAHSLRDGTFWEHAGKPTDTGEGYDLVVVGGGISGLAAAHFFRKLRGPHARVLILDNHDDFGGHAKRNEFQASRRLLGYGGTYAIESPAPYSAVAKGLIGELGIDVSSYPCYVQRDLYSSRGLVPQIFFDRENFGVDRLVVDPAPLDVGETGDCAGGGPESWKKFLAEAPLSEAGKRDIGRLFESGEDYFPGLSSTEKKARLARMSYANFLRQVVGVQEEIVRLYQAIPQAWFGLGIDAVSAQDAWGMGYPASPAYISTPPPDAA
jgi:spermidine dehydrogenase